MIPNMRRLMKLCEASEIRFEDTDPGFADMVQDSEFVAWFANSKIVDAAGQPLVVWHGLKKPLTHVDTVNKRILFSPAFHEFDIGRCIEPGAWFSPNQKVAQHYGYPAPFF